MPAEAVPWTRTEPVRSRRRRYPSRLPSPSSPPVSAQPCRAQPFASSAPPGCSGTAAGGEGYCVDLRRTTRSSPAAASRHSYRRPSPKTITTTTRRSSSSSSSSSSSRKDARLKSSYEKRLIIIGTLREIPEVAQMGRAGSGRRRLERDHRARDPLHLRDRRRTSGKRARRKPRGLGG